MKFSKGNEVLVKGVISMIDPYDDELPYRVDFLADDCDIWLSEKTIVSLVKASIAIPEGWNSIDVNPDHVRITNTSDDYIRNLQLLREDGTQGYGWKLWGNRWKWYGTEYDPQYTDPNFTTIEAERITDVIAWKELEDELLPVESVRRLEGWNDPDTLENRPGHTNTRNVQVIRENGQTGYGWRGLRYWYFTETYLPEMNNPEASYGDSLDTTNPVVGWKELEPVLPDGWTPADQYPVSDGYSGRNVQVLLKDGTQGYGWHCVGDTYWMYLGTEYSPEMHDELYNTNQVRSGDVVGWKELPIEPKPADPKPTFRLNIGDMIVYRQYVDWGVGEIIGYDYDDLEIPYKVNFPLKNDWYWVAEDSAVKVDL